MPSDVKKSADEVVEKVQAIFTPGIYVCMRPYATSVLGLKLQVSKCLCVCVCVSVVGTSHTSHYMYIL